MIYPNPVESKTFVADWVAGDIAQVDIYAENGSQTYSCKNCHAFSVDEFPSGVYTVIVYLKSGEIISEKMIVKD